MFLAIVVGAICFFLSFLIMLSVGFQTGMERFVISFRPVPEQSMSRWEIASLLVSLALSIIASTFVFRFCRKVIERPPL
jgi:hypothetical protein